VSDGSSIMKVKRQFEISCTLIYFSSCVDPRNQLWSFICWIFVFVWQDG